MDTDLLRTFIEVSKSRHFGRAAETLYLTQSAVSFRIRQLEQQLGVSLFARHRNNIQLTPSGEKLLPYAETILATLGKAKLDLGQQDLHKQQLAIGAPQFCWDLGLQEWLDGWLQGSVDHHLRLEMANREQLCRQLLERTLDIAILGEPSKIDEVTVKPFADYPLCLVSRQAGLSLNQLANQGWVAIENQALFSATPLPAELQHRKPVLITPSLRQAIHHLKRHGGVAYLPHPVVAPQIRDGELHLVEGAPSLNRTLYLAYLTAGPRDSHLNALIATPWRIQQKSGQRL